MHRRCRCALLCRTWSTSPKGERAGDRGSLFVIDCQATPCRIVGTGGSGADGSKTRSAAAESRRRSSRATRPRGRQLMVDDWAEANADLDVEAGLLPVADLFDAADPSRGTASMAPTRCCAQTPDSNCTGSDARTIEPGVRPGDDARRWSSGSTRDCGDAAGRARRWSTRRRSTPPPRSHGLHGSARQRALHRSRGVPRTTARLRGDQRGRIDRRDGQVRGT